MQTIKKYKSSNFIAGNVLQLFSLVLQHRCSNGGVDCSISSPKNIGLKGVKVTAGFITLNSQSPHYLVLLRFP